MRIRIQEHPGQVLVTLQTGPASYITLPATRVPADQAGAREYDIPSLTLTDIAVSLGGPTEEPAR